MRFAYADPPYIGKAKKHYGKEESYAGEVDHYALLQRLGDEFPDGWALSCSSTTLQDILGMCAQMEMRPRVAAWVKPFAVYKPGVNPAYGWEPVIFTGGRKRARSEEKVIDWLRASIAMQRGLVGAKPDPFCYWIFALLGMQADDELVDLFPGTGAVTKAWRQRQNQLWPMAVTS